MYLITISGLIRMPQKYCYFYKGMQYQMKFYFDNKLYITILNV